MDHLPIFIDLAARRVLVVGAGAAAARKVELLVRAGADVRLVAPSAVAALTALAAAGTIAWQGRSFAAADLAGMTLAFAATGIDDVDRAVSRAAAAAAVPVNVVDRPELSRFIMPAIVDRSPVVVAISSGGAPPVLARTIRAELERRPTRTTGAAGTICREFSRCRARDDQRCDGPPPAVGTRAGRADRRARAGRRRDQRARGHGCACQPAGRGNCRQGYRPPGRCRARRSRSADLARAACHAGGRRRGL